ncbi:uncharacterized protein LOC108159376 [Drosophila miranda]|uniref:uncharacterized protein LOC108159376 n=1 Tax=Drosophila miranda TaxID=7229 RepID=UPI0007E87012|nr:uncharacterized protein LOC108159376 [Drosophila miranda]
MDRDAQSVRSVMVILNILFSCFGLLYITVGSFMISVIRDYSIIDDTQIVPITVVVLGSAMVLLSLQSCYGLYREKPSVITCYSVLNLMLLLIHIYFVSYLWMELGPKMHMSSDSYPKYPASCFNIPIHGGDMELNHCREAMFYSWNMCANIIKFTSVMVIVFEFLTFAIGCYIADSGRNAERTQYLRNSMGFNL